MTSFYGYNFGDFLSEFFYLNLCFGYQSNDSYFVYFTANQELKKFIGKCHDGKTRSIKISIENGESFVHINFKSQKK